MVSAAPSVRARKLGEEIAAAPASFFPFLFFFFFFPFFLYSPGSDARRMWAVPPGPLWAAMSAAEQTTTPCMHRAPGARRSRPRRFANTVGAAANPWLGAGG